MSEAQSNQSRQNTGESPKVDGLMMKGKLKTSFKNVAEALRSLSFLKVAQEKEGVNAVYVESRDINKNPYLFSLLKVKENEIEIIYSIPQELAPKKRRLDIIRYLLNVITLIESEYNVENKVVYQLIESAVKDMGESVTLEYSKLYTAYDRLKKEVEDSKKKINRFTDENQALINRNYELKNKNDEMSLRLKELEELSDETLKAKIQEWIAEHSGEINIYEFSKTHKIPENRVEESLNRLVSEGYIELID